MIERLKSWAGVFGVIALLGGCSYMEGAAKYRWQDRIEAEFEGQPYIRKLKAAKVIYPESPASWFRPYVETLTYIMPDPLNSEGYYLLANHYDEGSSVVYYDIECSDRTAFRASPDADEGPIARDVLGEPLKDPEGRTFRYTTEKMEPLPDFLSKQLCDTSWKKEREAMRAARRNRT